VPAPPQAAREIFGPMLPAAQAYAELLAGPGVQRGLIGPGETDRIWERHLLNCAVVAELISPPCLLVDLGSGAGLPGIVLAMLLPQAEVILLEPMARRTVFLQECIAQLGLANAEVRRGRAEDVAGQFQADVVTARAIAALDRLAVLAAGLARPGGLVLAMKGAQAARELDQAGPVLRRLGATGVGMVEAGSGRISEPTVVVRFTTAVTTRRRSPAGGGRRSAGGHSAGDGRSSEFRSGQRR
jgi:16S rRNA (guanine527-N7)-methyltransferase